MLNECLIISSSKSFFSLISFKHDLRVSFTLEYKLNRSLYPGKLTSVKLWNGTETDYRFDNWEQETVNDFESQELLQ